MEASSGPGAFHDGDEDQPEETAANMDRVISSVGSSFANLNNMISEHLNQDFELGNLLPYDLDFIRSGKFISDMLGLSVGYFSFEAACRGGESYLVSSAPAPIHSFPPNPFTGNLHDKDCLLECLNALNTEEDEQRRKELYARYCAQYENTVAPKELFLCASRHNRDIQQLLNIIDDIVSLTCALLFVDTEKPQPFKLKPIFKTRATRSVETPQDAGLLEKLLVTLNKGGRMQL
ncbi:mediator complex subunit med8 [Cystoisospora suis]|uniref:Mediator complex subunit med8 n=1 Tax=Cystoisospora suis TaxID=483139 RepID=A0A2C6LDM3_9APIC|nr:mediator complex subunit med8 [Cystoisospora suis]